jgi:hypothetical protein
MKKALISFVILFVLLIPALALAATSVEGIIDSDTIWDLANSPYTLTANLQIADGVTLTIEPGVHVNCAEGEFYSIQIWGTLEAVGTATSTILFDDVQIQPKSSSAFVHVEFAEINEGSFIGKRSLGGLILRDSEMNNHRSDFAPEGCSQGCIVERNVFFHDSQTSVTGWHDATFRYNVFYNVIVSVRFADAIFEYNSICAGRIGLPGGSDIRYNSFRLDPRWLARTPSYFMVGGNEDANAANNYWGTTDTDTIDSVIRDRNDDLNIGGFINYTPILTSPNPNTPICTRPVAYFSASPVTGDSPLIVQFTDQSSGVITDWLWDFGDGGTSTDQGPTYTYNTPGIY